MKPSLYAVLVACFFTGMVAAHAGTAAEPQKPEPKKTDGYIKYTHTRAHFDLNPDATYTETIEVGMQVLDQKGIDAVNSYSVSYSDSLSELQVVDAYTLKQDGKKISVPKNNYQVESNTGENGAAPIISDIKTKTVLFPDVSVGDSVNITYKLIQKEAMFPKQFSFSMLVPDSVVIENGEVSVSAPESLALRIEARGIKGGEVAKKDGKRQWVWTYENHEIAKPDENYAYVSRFDYAPRLIITTFKDYKDLADAYEARARSKVVVSERVKKLAEEIAGKAKEPREAAALLYNWVAKNIHYAGNCIGVGSVVPHDIDHILDNKVGDCKDHTLLLQALLEARGISSSPALVGTGSSYTVPELPTVSQFDHVINYIPSLNLYADSTAQNIPFGSLPVMEEGKPTLLTTGFKEITHTPATDNSKQWSKSEADVTLQADGGADVILKTQTSGTMARSAQAFFKRVEMTLFKADVIRKIIQSMGLKGSGEYLHYDDVNADASTYNFEVKYHLENAVNLPGPTGIHLHSMLLGMHYGPIESYAGTANKARPEHNFMCMGGEATVQITLHVPKEVEIIAQPKDVHLKGRYSQYDSTYKREGATITSIRHIKDNSPANVCEPDVYDGYHEIDTGILKDAKAQVILQ